MPQACLPWRLLSKKNGCMIIHKSVYYIEWLVGNSEKSLWDKTELKCNWRERDSHVEIWGKNIPGKAKSKWNESNLGKSLMCLRNIRKSVTEVQRISWRVVWEEVSTNWSHRVLWVTVRSWFYFYWKFKIIEIFLSRGNF